MKAPLKSARVVPLNTLSISPPFSSLPEKGNTVVFLSPNLCVSLPFRVLTHTQADLHDEVSNVTESPRAAAVKFNSK